MGPRVALGGFDGLSDGSRMARGCLAGFRRFRRTSGWLSHGSRMFDGLAEVATACRAARAREAKNEQTSAVALEWLSEVWPGSRMALARLADV